ncbi:ribonuclease domain-containing protein [Inhella gelatinilytica]|uniref:Ribonuclease N1 n=1 Tax=Inhella gelatinilytica TaxID=2795030 RepID=A0A931IUG5_9BURK|nr:ribonuclease domain-containing protein [Inhella gelatinilytica]MBH9551741.1 ribonuclease N1 [Inhella gelatinilytica]
MGTRTETQRPWRWWGSCIAQSLLLGALLAGSPAQAREAAAGSTPDVALSELPVQARRTHELVLAGGPFPFAKDGTVFGNRERLLPKKSRGHYREYTVKTPKTRGRGARRLVCGGEVPVRPEVCYYTEDHYSSFRRIVP